MDNVNNYIGQLLSCATGKEARPIIVSLISEVYTRYILSGTAVATEIVAIEDDMADTISDVEDLVYMISQLLEELNAGEENAEEA